MIAWMICRLHVSRVIAAAAFCVLLGSGAAEAQSARQPPPKTQPPPKPQPPAGPTPRAGSWEIGGGSLFAGGYDFDRVTAELTRNTSGGTGGFVQFEADPAVGRTGAIYGRLAYYFSPRLAVEGGLRFGRPVFRMELSADQEGAPPTVAEETLDQYVFDASVVWHFTRTPSTRSRLVPFVFGGAGYLRELHEGQELVETGAEYHAGAGVKYWFGNARRRFGIRGEGGLSFRDGGFDLEEKLRMVPLAGASLIYLF